MQLHVRRDAAAAVRQRLAAQAELRERRRVRDGLEDGVHEAGVAEVEEARAHGARLSPLLHDGRLVEERGRGPGPLGARLRVVGARSALLHG